MTLVEIALLGVAIVVDAIAVSAATGIAAPRVRLTDALRMGLVFGMFHIGMPGLGWILGSAVGPFVQAWDHWIAAALLALVALGMVRGLLAPQVEPAADHDASPFGLGALLPLAVATSIDALAVGIGLPMMGAPVVLTLATFGTLAFVVTTGTLLLVRRAGAALAPRAQRGLTLLGAAVLLGLALKIPIDHLTQGI